MLKLLGSKVLDMFFFFVDKNCQNSRFRIYKNKTKIEDYLLIVVQMFIFQH